MSYLDDGGSAFPEKGQLMDKSTKPRDLFTVKQFSARRPAWSENSLRNLILNAEDRINSRGEKMPGNGLAEAGAILKVQRRVLIDEEAFFRWVAAEQKRR